jgi:hypothetical protein
VSTTDEHEPDGNPEIPEPQGRLLGMPYDLRRPTVARARARLWNSADRRLLTPRTFGWGYDINFYWVAHPGRYLKSSR